MAHTTYRILTGALSAFALLGLSPNALADEGGVSFWVPGTFGSLAAVPQQAPGWSVTSIYYHTSVSAGADVARAREIHARPDSRESDGQRERQPKFQCGYRLR